MNRTTEITRKSIATNSIVRNKEYYFNTLNIEADLLKKATDIAERMMVAFMRENKVEVTLNVEDIAEKIVEKLGKRVYHPRDYSTGNTASQSGGFNYDDGPVILKTEKMEVKGKVGNISKTKDSIQESLDILSEIEI